MTDAFIFDGLRTPFGRHGGALAGVRPDDLLATTISALVDRGPFAPDAIDDLIVGCANQAGEDCRNVARRAGLLAGLPVEVPGLTVNRLCGSGLAAVLDAGRMVACSQAELVIAGGVESMSRAPFVFAKAERAYGRDVAVFDSTMGSRFPNRAVVERYGDHAMWQTADIVGRELGIGRDESDAFALASQRRYAAASASGFFAGEILPVSLPGGKRGETMSVAADEPPRPDTTAEGLARLKPLAADGVVTAGNASGINDGAASLFVGSAAAGGRAGAAPLARIVASAVVGVEPRTMGLGPVPSSRTALRRAGLSLDQMDVIEINEAFATQVLGCLRQLGLGADDPRVNPNGGAIAIGHPLGASGARLVLTAIRHLRRIGGRYALVTMCIGVGQGIAVVLERP